MPPFPYFPNSGRQPDSSFEMTVNPTSASYLRRASSLVCAGLALVLGAVPASAETLTEALAAAYANNPTLEAERAQLRATDEGLAEARSGYRPTVTATASAGVVESDSNISGSQTLNPVTYGVGVQQPLYRGGRTIAGTSQAKNAILGERERLRSVEQSVLLEAATAYMDVLRDIAVVELTVKNEQVLRRDLEATRDRASVGDATRTDVSQAEARLAGAIAGRIQAQGTLEGSRAVYRRIVGRLPEGLVEPQLADALPVSLDETMALAEQNNPDLLAAQYAQSAAGDEIDLARGEMLPTLTLNGAIEHREDSVAPGSEIDSMSVIAQLTIPLYEAGGPSARVRRAKHVEAQRQYQSEAARRGVMEQATRAWQGLESARAAVDQFQIQVQASEIALGGTRQQARVGSRSILDVLNAEQELLDAQVNLVRARAGSIVAQLQVLAAVGRLNARDMALPVEYFDEEAYYKKAKGRIWGTGIGDGN